MGSVKTNLGHLEGAAGIVGLIKAVLALQHRTIPPHLHFRTLNPHVALNGAPIEVPVKPQPWIPLDGVRIAGVSSFGIGGTNAHVVLAEAPERDVSSRAQDGEPDRPGGRAGRRAPAWQILPLSAKSGAALDRATTDLVAFLRTQPDVDLADVAFTLRVGRSAFHRRRAVIARDTAEAIRALEGAAPHLRWDGLAAEEPADVVFALAPEMPEPLIAELRETEPVFRAEFERVAAEAGAAAQTGSGLQLAVAVALAALWRSLGVTARAFAGDGVAAVAARHLSGELDLAAAIAASTQETLPVAPRPDVVTLDLLASSATEQRRAETLARLWLAGVTLDGRAGPAPGRCRLALPTYPFERQRYWVSAPAAGEPAARRRDLAEWFYLPTWKEAALAVPAGDTAVRWCVVGDGSALARRIVERLRAARASVVVLEAGDAYEELEAGRHRIDPTASADYARALRGAWAGSDAGRSIVLHLLATGEAGAAGDPRAEFAAAQRSGFYSLIALARALNELGAAAESWPSRAVSGRDRRRSRRPRARHDERPAEGHPAGAPRPALPPHRRRLAADAGGRSAARRSHPGGGARHRPRPGVALRGVKRWVRAYEPWPLAAPARPEPLAGPPRVDHRRPGRRLPEPGGAPGQARTCEAGPHRRAARSPRPPSGTGSSRPVIR